MKHTVVQYAFQNPFLMHTILALASLHLQHLGEYSNGRRALAYRAKAFEGYRKAVEEANPQTFPALLANSLLLTATSSQAFRDKDSQPLFIIDWMIVWRGIGVIIELMGIEAIIKSGLGELFHRPPMAVQEAPPLIPSQLLFMVASISPEDPEFSNVDTYTETLKYLGLLYSNLQRGFTPTMELRIITWPTFLPKPFIDLIRKQKPPALIILAHYAIFLKIASRLWWLKGVGHRSISDLCTHLTTTRSDPKWVEYLIAPRAALLAETDKDLARIALEDPTWEPPVVDWREEIRKGAEVKKTYEDIGGPKVYIEEVKMAECNVLSPKPADWEITMDVEQNLNRSWEAPVKTAQVDVLGFSNGEGTDLF